MRYSSAVYRTYTRRKTSKRNEKTRKMCIYIHTWLSHVHTCVALVWRGKVCNATQYMSAAVSLMRVSRPWLIRRVLLRAVDALHLTPKNYKIITPQVLHRFTWNKILRHIKMLGLSRYAFFKFKFLCYGPQTLNFETKMGLNEVFRFLKKRSVNRTWKLWIS